MRRIAASLAAVALLVTGYVRADSGSAETLPPTVPVGFVVTVAGVSLTATSLAFAPDGSTLYVTAASRVLRYPVLGGVIAGPPAVFVDGLNQPLGVLASDDAVFVADSVPGVPRSTGVVYRLRDTNGDGRSDVTETLIAGLPNGRHNTNGMALGPDGMLYITNGNATDSGFGAEGGQPEVRPYSGSVLRVDPAATGLTPSPGMVVATGFRNIYDIAFVPPGHPAATPGTAKAVVTMNGPDGLTYDGVARPRGEDTLNVFDTADGAVEHFGFPWCLYDRAIGGRAGFAQDPAQGACDPLPAAAFEGLSAAVQAKPSALFGMHVSANGVAFDPGTNFPADATGDLYVAEFGNFFGTTPAGHKVVRVRFAADGTVASVDDFMTGVLPLDLTFAPDGALWVADYTGLIFRVANLAG